MCAVCKDFRSFDTLFSYWMLLTWPYDHLHPSVTDIPFRQSEWFSTTCSHMLIVWRCVLQKLIFICFSSNILWQMLCIQTCSLSLVLVEVNSESLNLKPHRTWSMYLFCVRILKHRMDRLIAQVRLPVSFFGCLRWTIAPFNESKWFAFVFLWFVTFVHAQMVNDRKQHWAHQQEEKKKKKKEKKSINTHTWSTKAAASDALKIENTLKK